MCILGFGEVAIPFEAWMEVDLRSGDTASLRTLEKQFRQAVNDAVAHENVRKRMSVPGFIAVFDRKVPASPPKALPIVTFDPKRP